MYAEYLSHKKLILIDFILDYVEDEKHEGLTIININIKQSPMVIDNCFHFVLYVTYKRINDGYCSRRFYPIGLNSLKIIDYQHVDNWFYLLQESLLAFKRQIELDRLVR